MNVEVESLPNCITSLKVELPPEKVNATRLKITQDYKNYAKIPGYRPGKAPQAVIEKKFQKEIKEELTKKLVDEAFRDAVKEQKLRVLSISDVQDVEIDEDKTMRFTAMIITQPVFDLPDYLGLAVTVPSAEVQPGDVERALENLREQHADFVEVTGRGAEMGDFAVVDYTGTIDGKPVDEVVAKAGKVLSGNTGFWIKMGPDSFFKGFCDQLVGAQVEETRTFSIVVPQDFPVIDLAGRSIEFVVMLQAIKQQQLPELDDALAEKIIEGHTLAQLQVLLAQEIGEQRAKETDRVRRDQIMNQLLAAVECELPQEMVLSETRRIMNEIVQQNKEKGVSDEALRQNEHNIVAQAGKAAREQLKGRFILTRIAEKEEIRINRNEVDARVDEMAVRYRVTPEKMQKELARRDAFGSLQEDILMGKVLDFLASKATVTVAAQPQPVVS